MSRRASMPAIGDTFDMFSEPAPAPAASASAATVAANAASLEPDAPVAAPRAAVTAEQLRLLECLFGDRKAIFKSMGNEERLRLATATGILVAARERAYLAAASGHPGDAFGWMVKRPDLAEATAALNAYLLDLNAIPLLV